MSDVSARYRKKAVVVDAFRWNGELGILPGWAFREIVEIEATKVPPLLHISTLEGIMTVSLGDWVIRGVKGEVYPCKPEIFDMTYEPADAASALTPLEKDLRDSLKSALALVNERCGPDSAALSVFRAGTLALSKATQKETES